MLCRRMSKPTAEVWSAALHMLTWMRAHKQRGIKFTAAGNHKPVAFADASNKCYSDGKVQFGYRHYLGGGPIICKSSKLKHVGIGGSSQVEYMALAHCNQATVWLAQLLFEMGLGYLVDEPIVTFGDNLQSNKLAREDVVTSGNQYIYLPYHYNKEVEEAGIVATRDLRTHLMLADLDTKAAPPQTFAALLDKATGYSPVQQM